MSDMASAYLDALRAAGANLVIASHVLALYFGIRDPYSLGNLGVAVFFLLSGFLIMQSMLNWLNKPEPRDLIMVLVLTAIAVLVTPPLVTAIAEASGLSARASIDSGLLLAHDGLAAVPPHDTTR